MTREELIAHLEHLAEYVKYSEDAPALREAIEMLKCSEMPNGSDTIYRQAAIDTIFNEPLYKSGMKKRDVDMVVPAIYEKIKSLPPARPETHEERTETHACDLIKRQDAIDAVNSIDNLDAKARGGICFKLIGLPSAQPEQRWIPCSERLPENDDSVLATTAWGDVTIAERVYPPINDTCWFIHDGNTNATINDVVAWMPLPEPYKERREK